MVSATRFFRLVRSAAVIGGLLFSASSAGMSQTPSAQRAAKDASLTFSPSFFGEDPKKKYEPTPDESDFLHHYGPCGPHGSRNGCSGASGRQARKEPSTEAPATPLAPANRAISNGGGAAHPISGDSLSEPGSDGILGWLRRKKRVGYQRPDGPAAGAGGRPGAGPDIAKTWSTAGLEGDRTGPSGKNAAGSPRTSRGADEDLRRYALWTGLNAPIVLPAERASLVSLDQAAAEARADYGRKILGEYAAAPLQSTESLLSASYLDSGISSAAAAGGLFVGVELDISGHPGEYRDSAAELSRTASFSADGRFPALLNERRDRVQFWGRLPADRLLAAFQVIGVTRVEIAEPSKPQPREFGDGLEPRMLVGLRMPPDVAVREALDTAVSRLYRQAGFIWERTVGIQRIPGSNENAVIIMGHLPARNMDRLLADSSVVKIRPVSAADVSPARRSGELSSGVLFRFLSYAFLRHPIELALALLVSILLLRFGSAAQPRRRGL